MQNENSFEQKASNLFSSLTTSSQPNTNTSYSPIFDQHVSQVEAQMQKIFETDLKEDKLVIPNRTQFSPKLPKRTSRKLAELHSPSKIETDSTQKTQITSETISNDSLQTVPNSQQTLGTTEKKKVIVRVKRKRTEEPVNNLYVDVAPARKKMGIFEEVISKFENNLQLADITPDKLVKCFTLIETVPLNQNYSTTTPFRSLIKDAQSSREKHVNKQKEQHKRVLQAAKAQKIEKLRNEAIVDVQLIFEKPTPKRVNIESKIEEDFSDDEEVYDLYHLEEKAVPIQQVVDSREEHVIKIENFDEDLLFDENLLNEYEKEDNEFDYDSEDSNAEEFYANDYPEEDVTEFGYNEEDEEDHRFDFNHDAYSSDEGNNFDYSDSSNKYNNYNKEYYTSWKRN